MERAATRTLTLTVTCVNRPDVVANALTRMQSTQRTLELSDGVEGSSLSIWQGLEEEDEEGDDEADATDEKDTAPEQDPDAEIPGAEDETGVWSDAPGITVLSVGAGPETDRWTPVSWFGWALDNLNPTIVNAAQHDQPVEEIGFRIVRADQRWLAQWRLRFGTEEASE